MQQAAEQVAAQMVGAQQMPIGKTGVLEAVGGGRDVGDHAGAESGVIRTRSRIA